MSAIELAVASLADDVPAECREMPTAFYELAHCYHFVFDSPFNAVEELGPGFYSVVAYNRYNLRKVFEIRKPGQDVFEVLGVE